MSRIATKPISIPKGVEVTVNEKTVKAKGKNGEMERTFDTQLGIKMTDDGVMVTIPGFDGPAGKLERKAYAPELGLIWKLIANMIEGVEKGFSKKLMIEGVGYRAAVNGNKLVVQVGYSNDRVLDIPDGLKVEAPEVKRGELPYIVVSGADKNLVGSFAAYIKKQRPVEPYKGKGIRYDGEYVRRKEGKAAGK